MKLSQFLSKDSIVADLESTDKTGVIKELAEKVSSLCNITAEEIAAILMEREALGSTGIGGGIAIPHGKLNIEQSIIIGFGLSRKGVEYDSLDNRPVHIFFLLLTSENSTGGHLKVLAQISKLLKIDEFKQGLLSAASVDDIFDVIQQKDEVF